MQHSVKFQNAPHYKNLARFDHLENREDVLIVRFDSRLYYANITYFQQEIEQRIEQKGAKLKLFVLDADSMNGLDSSGVHALEKLASFCKARKIEFFITGVKGPVRDILHRCEFYEKHGAGKFFLRIQHAVDTFDKEPVNDYTGYALQNNEDLKGEN